MRPTCRSGVFFADLEFCFYICRVVLSKIKGDEIMSAVEFEAEKALLARDILNIEDWDLLNEVKEMVASLFRKTEKEEFIEKEELLKHIDNGLKDIKAGRFCTAAEFLEEFKS